MSRKITIFLLMLLAIAVPATAQSAGVLTPGSPQFGTLSDQSPISLYTVNGSEGDLIIVRVIAVSQNMAVNATLLSPNQQPLGLSESDPFLGQTMAVRLSARLQDSGAHNVLVGGTPGDYLIMLDLLPGQTVQQLDANTPAAVNISSEVPARTLGFAASGAGGSSLLLQPSASDVYFLASLFDEAGSLAAAEFGSGNICLNVPAAADSYFVVVESQPTTPFDVTAQWQTEACGGAGSISGSTTSATATLVPPSSSGSTPGAASPVSSTGACTASGGGAVNIRSGPDTIFNIIGTLNAGQSIAVMGSNGAGWYVIQSPSIPVGWVSASVISLSGDCASLPTIQYGETVPAPVATEDADATGGAPTYTYTPTQAPGEPTYTPSPTYTATEIQENGDAPTATYTPTYTETPPAQTAPPDSNYVINIPLDGTASTTDFVSYPDGDREDRVSWNVTGLNPSVALPGGRANLTISVSCFGTGTQHITFFTGGQTYQCGETIVNREVGFDNNSGSVLITAVSGQGTYVQWVVTGTATRIN